MLIKPEDCVLELHQIEYDKNELVKIYEEVKEKSRVKYLPWRETPKEFTKRENAKALILQYDDHEIRNPADHRKGVNLLQFDYIKQLVSKFNFDHEIHAGHITMLIYNDNFVFKPHVDGYAKSVVMFPIILPPIPSPVDFYEYDQSYEINREFDIDEDRIAYTHYYSDINPTIFNSHLVHGVRSTTGFQVKMKININEDFSSILEKYKNGTLIRKD